MKGTLTQYVTLGVMLFLLVLIVSMYPEQHGSKVTGQADTETTVSKLAITTQIKSVRTN